jgi:hypothetical protein
MRFFSLLITAQFLFGTSSCAQKQNMNLSLAGPWLITLTTKDVGQLQLLMTFEATESEDKDSSSFRAYSQKDIDKLVLGSLRAGLGRIAGSNFKDGCLIRIANGSFSKDSIHGVLVTPFGNYHIDAQHNNGTLDGLLTDGRRTTVGTVQANKGMPIVPLRNYPLIVDSALNLVEARLYDPAILKTKAWKEFTKEIKRISTLTGDDAALVMAFFYYGRKLPFSHFALYRQTNTPSAPENEPEANSEVRLINKDDKTAYLIINSFAGDAETIDSIFRQIAAKDYKHLVVDLRGNSGGSIEAGMAFIRHLLPDTVYGGVFLTQKYFVKNRALPRLLDYQHFPHFSEANYDLLIKGISDYEAVCLKAYPQPPIFRGETYVLTDEKTASTCEPIVYALKQLHLATIVGKTTAGAMLNGESFSAGEGFMITVPTATYYTSDGVKIDQRGVEPDIASKDALAFVLEKISKKGD